MLQQFGIDKDDWIQTPASVKAALVFLWQQNHRLSNRCDVYDLQLQKLQVQVTELKQLQLENAELRERLGQNSSNSSKPPSSDPPSKPQRTKNELSERKRGGQPGHQGHGRKLLPIEKVDDIIDLRPVSCSECGALLLGDDLDPARRQISELPAAKTVITEYRQHTLSCSCCGAQNKGEWPEKLPAGAYGPRAQAVIGYLTGRMGLSHRDVIEYMEVLHGLDIGLGTVAAVQKQIANALEQPVKTAQQYIHQQSSSYVDETRWPESDKHKWLWINATKEVTVFKITGGRGKAEAKEVIGKGHKGIVNTDRYAAYNWLDPHRHQLCFAHLKRDFQAIKERGAESEKIGEELLAEVKKLFEHWHHLRESKIDRATFQAKMEPVKKQVHRLLQSGTECPQKKTQNTCQNLLKVEQSLWTFVRTEGIESTNNNAERLLRRAVLWRRKSFGTQSESGSRFVERILTVVTSLRQQGRDVLNYLSAACSSLTQRSNSICLLPDTS